MCNCVFIKENLVLQKNTNIENEYFQVFFILEQWSQVILWKLTLTFPLRLCEEDWCPNWNVLEMTSQRAMMLYNDSHLGFLYLLHLQHCIPHAKVPHISQASSTHVTSTNQKGQMPPWRLFTLTCGVQICRQPKFFFEIFFLKKRLKTFWKNKYFFSNFLKVNFKMWLPCLPCLRYSALGNIHCI